MLPWLRGGVKSPPPALPPSRLLSLRSCSSSQLPPALSAAVSPAPPRRYLPATMAHRGPPSARKRPGPTVPDRSFQALRPLCWPRSWPLLLLLLLVVLLVVMLMMLPWSMILLLQVKGFIALHFCTLDFDLNTAKCLPPSPL